MARKELLEVREVLGVSFQMEEVEVEDHRGPGEEVVGEPPHLVVEVEGEVRPS